MHVAHEFHRTVDRMQPKDEYGAIIDIPLGNGGSGTEKDSRIQLNWAIYRLCSNDFQLTQNRARNRHLRGRVRDIMDPTG